MIEWLMIVATVLLVAAYVYIIYKKRKNMTNPHGWKSFVTPTVFILAPVFALLSYIFNFGGAVVWLILGVCFFTGAFFTKYLPLPDEGRS